MATPQSFFVFCLGDFDRKLSIPGAFVEQHRLHLLHQLSLQLKTRPGRSWAVNIKKINGVFYIADGWFKFVKDNDVLQMKLVIFYIVAQSTLHVSIFDHHSCFQLPPSSSVGGQGRFIDDRPRFDFFLTHRRKYRMSVYDDFGEKADLKDKKCVMLKYPPQHRCWPVLLEKRRLRRHYTLELTQGWLDFTAANGLVYGRTYSFEFDSSENVILVKEKK